MGTIDYNSERITTGFDDRTLAHLQKVITTKLRRGESFLFSWQGDVGVQGGRSSIWIHPSIPLRIDYRPESAKPTNRAWLSLLMASANTNEGLRLVEEPAPADAEGRPAMRSGRPRDVGRINRRPSSPS